jgi:hypothetical protein
MEEFSTYPVIRVDEDPSTPRWRFPIMFRRGANGTYYVWQIGFDSDNMHLLTMHGTMAAKSLDVRDVETNTSGRTAQEQGVLVARSKYKNKFYDGYTVAGSEDRPKVKGMKGYPYKEGCIKDYPVAVGPKLNGIRLLITHLGSTSIECKSYMNRKFTHLSFIEEEVKAFAAYLPSFFTLDGEMYCHGMKFNEITSAVKTVNDEHANLSKIIYCIFDIYVDHNPPFEERYQMMLNAYSKYVEDGGSCNNILIVENELAYSHEEIVDYKDRCLSVGYEGAVIRKLCNGAKEGSTKYKMSQYSFGRSTRIYKLKDFIDEEGTVVSVISAAGKEKGAALLIIKDKFGIEVPVRFGTMEERRKWLDDPSLVIGRPFTFKYFERGPNNAPIQPGGVAFRDYE